MRLDLKERGACCNCASFRARLLEVVSVGSGAPQTDSLGTSTCHPGGSLRGGVGVHGHHAAVGLSQVTGTLTRSARATRGAWLLSRTMDG